MRFAVIADDGRRSTAWAVWTNRRTLDAYLDVRPLSGRWKISLHQSGSWQSGLAKEWAFHDGSTLRLVSRQIPWMTVDVEWLLTQKTAMLSRIDPETLINARAPRGIITGKHDHGMRFAVDVSGDLDSSP